MPKVDKLSSKLTFEDSSAPSSVPLKYPHEEPCVGDERGEDRAFSAAARRLRNQSKVRETLLPAINS